MSILQFGGNTRNLRILRGPGTLAEGVDRRSEWKLMDKKGREDEGKNGVCDDVKWFTVLSVMKKNDTTFL